MANPQTTAAPAAPATAAAPAFHPGPKPGTMLADFTLKMGTKDGVQDFTLSQHLGKGPVVLAFFPLAFTGVCTKEMCDFRDNLARFDGLGAKVFGFSTDTPFTNVEFARHQALPFGIVSDPNRDVVGKVWQTMDVAGVRNVAKRGVLVLGADGAVKWSSVSDDPKQWVGTDEVRKALGGH